MRTSKHHLSLLVQRTRCAMSKKESIGLVGITHTCCNGVQAVLTTMGINKMDERGFVPAGELIADGRSRMAFGKVGVRHDDKYAVAVNDDGEILLTPLASVPLRELLIWENAQVREALSRGLLEAAAGDVDDLGDFTQFIDKDDDA